MTITLDDIINLQHNKLNTLSRKLIYLMIQGNAKVEGWATISRNDFSTATTLPSRSVDTILKYLVSIALIERRKSGDKHSSPYQYRIIKP